MFPSLSPSLSISLSLSPSLPLSLSLLNSKSLTRLVGLLDIPDLGVCTSAQDLDEATLVRSGSLHGPAEGLGIVEGLGLQQSQNTLFKITTQLRLELLDQILHVHWSQYNIFILHYYILHTPILHTARQPE